MIVVDTNVITYLHIKGAHTSKAESLYVADPDWAVPALWRSEFSNILVRYVRNNLLTSSDAHRLLTSAETVLRNNEFRSSASTAIDLAIQSGCSAYDCEFVALAMDLNTHLYTADKKILRKFPKIAKAL